MNQERSIGQHGSNIFFKEFSTCDRQGKLKSYSLGTFYFVQKSPDYPVAIAEFQLIWQNIKNGNNYASVKLYFIPKDAGEISEEYEEIGEDEVFEADKHVVIECNKFSEWECSSTLWSESVGKPVYDGICKKSIEEMYLFKINAKFFKKVDVKILSFPQYCRYKTCAHKLKNGVKLQGFSLLAAGGLDLCNLNTIVLFSRWKFCKKDITTFSLTDGIQLPVFTGRPRKKKLDITRGKELKNSLSLKKMKMNMTNSQQKNTSTEVPEVCIEPNAFKTNLYSFMKKKGTPILKIPSIGCAKIDLYKLFKFVESYGGYGQVTLKKQWRIVYNHLGHSSTITNAATCTRKAYESLLLPYERHLRKKSPQVQKKNELDNGIQIPRLNTLLETSSHNHLVNNNSAGPFVEKTTQLITQDSSIKSRHELFKSVTNSSLLVKSRIDSVKNDDVMEVTLNTNGHGTDVKTVDTGEAFRLMIQKRRGRPSKDFRDKLEKLRQIQNKVEVEIHPPLNKYQKIPAWLNELNVEIVNPNRNSQHSFDEQQQKNVPRPLKPNPSFNSVGEFNENPFTATRNVFPKGIYNSMEEITETTNTMNDSSVKPCHEINTNHNICEFKIQSVRSLATSQLQKEDPKRSQYIHYPNFSSNKNMLAGNSIAIPPSVFNSRDLLYRERTDNKTSHVDSADVDQEIGVIKTSIPYSVDRSVSNCYTNSTFGHTSELPVTLLHSNTDVNSVHSAKLSSEPMYRMSATHELYPPIGGHFEKLPTKHNVQPLEQYSSNVKYLVEQPRYIFHHPIYHREDRSIKNLLQVFRSPENQYEPMSETGGESYRTPQYERYHSFRTPTNDRKLESDSTHIQI